MAAIDEITIPGGVCVFFTETGGVERSLGNIVGDSVSVDRESDEIEHFTNKSGIRRKDKIFTVEENAQIDFEIDEINVDNLRYFFKGASISTVGAGTTLITDQKATSAVEEFVSVGQPGLSPGVTARQFLDYCLVDTNGVFVNNSVETDTAAGTAFTGLVNTVTDFVYLGKLTQFSEVEFDMDTSGTGHTAIDYEYWDGTAWTSISVGLVDGTTNQTGDGILTYTLMTDWALTTVNGISAYWIRFSEPTTVTISATYFSIGRQALIEHTDFGVDPGSAAGAGATKNGGVRRIAAGILEPGEEFKVTFTYTTFVSQTFGIAEQSTIEGSARFVNNPQSGRGKHWEMTFPRCQLNNNGAMDLDDTDFQTIPLSLVVLDNSAVDTVNPFGTVTVFP
tara:strand:- start:2091 stop:3269 length:1179 start_codon:yes stop_codon:yes gene_type:complete